MAIEMWLLQEDTERLQEVERDTGNERGWEHIGERRRSKWSCDTILNYKCVGSMKHGLILQTPSACVGVSLM